MPFHSIPFGVQFIFLTGLLSFLKSVIWSGHFSVKALTFPKIHNKWTNSSVLFVKFILYLHVFVFVGENAFSGEHSFVCWHSCYDATIRSLCVLVTVTFFIIHRAFNRNIVFPQLSLSFKCAKFCASNIWNWMVFVYRFVTLLTNYLWIQFANSFFDLNWPIYHENSICGNKKGHFHYQIVEICLFQILFKSHQSA